MKRFVLLFFITTFLTANAQEHNFKDFYNSHQKESMLSFSLPLSLAKPFIDKEDLSEEILAKVTNFKILICDNNKAAVLNDFKKFSKKNKLKTLLRAKEGKGKVVVYFLEEGKFIKEIILIAGDSNKEVVLMGLQTEKLTKDELATLIANEAS